MNKQENKSNNVTDWPLLNQNPQFLRQYLKLKKNLPSNAGIKIAQLRESKPEDGKTIRPKIKENMTESEYAYIHKQLNSQNFYPNRTPLSDSQITCLKQALVNEKEDSMYSKKYLQEKGVSINRGGILRRWNEEEKKYELFAVIKSDIKNNAKAIRIGEGAFGKIKLIQNLDTKEISVLKTLTQPRVHDFFQQEAEILHQIGRGHKKIFKKKIGKNNKDKGQLYSIQDFVYGNNLRQTLKSEILHRHEQLDISVQALLALKELHDNNILHRDIKPANLMYHREKKHVSLVDFGFAIRGLEKTKATKCGTDRYMAPEISQEGHFSTASDVYALGVTLEDIFELYANKSYPEQKEISEINKLAQLMHEPDRKKRISLKNSLIHLLEIEDQYNTEQLKKIQKKNKFYVLATNNATSEIEQKKLEKPTYTLSRNFFGWTLKLYNKSAVTHIPIHQIPFLQETLDESSKHNKYWDRHDIKTSTLLNHRVKTKAERMIAEYHLNKVQEKKWSLASNTLTEARENQSGEHLHEIMDETDLEWLLITAAKKNDLESIELLLQNKININQPDTIYGNTALMHAAQAGHVNVVKLLLEAKADVNQTNDEQHTAVTLAANNHSKNAIKILKLLLLADANPSILPARWGYRIFSTATEEEVEKLCQKIPTKELGRFLLIAAERGNIETAQILLKHHADIDIVDDIYGNTALILAAQNGYVEMVDLLLSANANINRKNLKNGDTALMIAIKRGHSNVAKKLLSANADANQINNEGKTALRLVSSHRLEDAINLIKLLMIAGADCSLINSKLGYDILKTCSPEETEKFCNTLSKKRLGNILRIAASEGDDKAVIQLLIAKADASFEWSNPSNFEIGYKLLKLCTEEEAIKLCQVIDKKDLGGFMLAAVEHGDINVVRHLISMHADINQKNSEGQNALMLIPSQNKETEETLAKMLLIAGIDTSTLSARYGYHILTKSTPKEAEKLYLVIDKKDLGRILVVAAEHNDIRIVTQLLNAKADVNQKNNNGWTALNFATQSRNHEMQALLRAVRFKEMQTDQKENSKPSEQSSKMAILKQKDWLDDLRAEIFDPKYDKEGRYLSGPSTPAGIKELRNILSNEPLDKQFSLAKHIIDLKACEKKSFLSRQFQSSLVQNLYMRFHLSAKEIEEPSENYLIKSSNPSI